MSLTLTGYKKIAGLNEMQTNVYILTNQMKQQSLANPGDSRYKFRVSEE